jgi:hypothetical protein
MHGMDYFDKHIIEQMIKIQIDMYVKVLLERYITPSEYTRTRKVIFRSATYWINNWQQWQRTYV